MVNLHDTNRWRLRAWAASLMIAILGLVSFLILARTELRAAAPSKAPAALDLSLQVFATGLNEPVSLTNAGDSRLFAVERSGVIRVIEANGTVLPTPFLDISTRVDDSDDEEGLLGLVFHPNYASNGYFYVNYVNTSGQRRTRISRFEVTGDPNIADSNSEEILLTIDQHSGNHNAGDIHFGPDGYLYIPLGDGGGSGDTGNNAQSMDRLLGKISRIDVDSGPGGSPECAGLGTGNYTVPATNPFTATANTCDEIWAAGFRNPWRSSFDRATGDFYVGDVGQFLWEEVDRYPAGQPGGLNFGWRCYEGNHDFNLSGCGPMGSYTFPIFEYSSANGTGNCTVIGGYVYRGSNYPVMGGRYLLADYCSGRVWDLVRSGNAWQETLHTGLPGSSYVSFGEDIDGELYLVSQNGTIYAIQENTVLSEFVYLPLIRK